MFFMFGLNFRELLLVFIVVSIVEFFFFAFFGWVNSLSFQIIEEKIRGKNKLEEEKMGLGAFLLFLGIQFL